MSFAFPKAPSGHFAIVGSAQGPEGGGGHFHINLYVTCRFQGIIFQHKFPNGIWKLIRNSETGYDYLFKNNRLLFPRTISHCFCNLIIPKQGIEMQIFFLNGLWRFLKNGHLHAKLHSSAPLPPGLKENVASPLKTAVNSNISWYFLLLQQNRNISLRLGAHNAYDLFFCIHAGSFCEFRND